jgi:hypothetical protein
MYPQQQLIGLRGRGPRTLIEQLQLISIMDICNNCFYNNRLDRHISCTHGQRSGRVYVEWNADAERLETTQVSIRPPPANLEERVGSGYVAMCFGDIRCKGDDCTFAHGKAEKTAWNKFLRK